MPTNRFGDHSSSGHLSRILDDKTPQLGGMLDGNGFTFNGAVAFEAQAGEALSKGNAVYVSGVSGNKPVVMKADADDAAKMPAFGIAETDANLHANVNVVTFGTVYEIDTSAYAAGDELYVSTTPGVLTATKPTGATAKLQNIGKVIRSHASAGSIKVGGAGRTNAVPNLDDGTVFIGDVNNQAEQRALVLADISDYVAPTETDPVYTASSWYTTTNNSSNWDTAYGWGDHGTQNYAVTTGDTFTGRVTLNSATYNDHLRFVRTNEDWVITPSTDGSLDITRQGGTGSARVDFNSMYITVNGSDVTSTTISNWNSAYSDTSAATNGNTGSTLVKRTADGDSNHRYLYTTNVNMSSGINTTTAVTRFAASYDSWLRWADATTTRAGLDVPTRTGGNASGTWGINITGNAADSDKQSMIDTRAALLDPNSYPDFSIYGEFTNKINGSWWSAITAKGWHDGYAAWQLIGYSSTGTDNRLYFKNSHGTNNTWSGLQEVWHAGSDGSGSGLDADTVDGVDSSQIIFGANASGTYNSNPNTPVKSGFYDIYGTANNAPTNTWYCWINLRHTNLSSAWGHQIAGSFYSNGDIYNRYVNNGTYGGWAKIWNTANDGSGSGLDADTVDGIHGASFIRSDADDTITGKISVGSTSSRRAGMYGLYDSYKIGHIWSMGSAYQIPQDGSSFGNLYGAAYTYHNRVYTSNTMGSHHQMVWCQNGTPNCALGTNIWTSGNVTAYSDARVKTNIEVIPDALDKVKQLNGYTFDRTDIDIPRQTGVIAQEVLEVLPEAVTGDEDSHYNVSYGNMVGLLIEAIKEQQRQIEELKEMIKCQ